MPTTFDFAALTAVVASDKDLFIQFSCIAIHTEQLLSSVLPISGVNPMSHDRTYASVSSPEIVPTLLLT